MRTLIPNPNFVTVMRDYGYENLTVHDLFSAVASNLTSKYVGDLMSAGFSNVDFAEVEEQTKPKIVFASL